MIIKMELASEELTAVGTSIEVAWRFIGNLASVDRFPYYPDYAKVSIDMFDEFYEGAVLNVGGIPYILIKAKRENGNSVGIVTNLSIYLLNDNGKTIERLN